MAREGRDTGSADRPDPTLRGVVADRLLGAAIGAASRPILGALMLGAAVGLFLAWFLVFAILGLIVIALGWARTDGTGTPVMVAVLVISVLILLRPARWVARKLVRVQGGLDDTAERLAAVPPSLDPGALAAALGRAKISPTDLRALDARHGPPPTSAPGQTDPEQPEG